MLEEDCDHRVFMNKRIFIKFRRANNHIQITGNMRRQAWLLTDHSQYLLR